MTQYAILSAIGIDRPGLVDEVSQFIFERGGNIEDSRMVNLRGQFAVMVLVGGTGEALARLRADIEVLAARSRLHAELSDAASQRSAAPQGAMPYRLKATAMDQAGLVHRLAHLLRTLDVNIESLETRLAAAPYTGSPVFEMDMVVSVPQKTALSHLRKELGRLCDECNIDWELSAETE